MVWFCIWCFIIFASMQGLAPLAAASEWKRPTYLLAQSTGAANDKEQPADDTPLVITDIQFRLEKGTKERVLVFANRFIDPTVMALEGEKPRFVVDVRNTHSVKKGLKTIPVNGQFIQQIRTHHDTNTRTLRIVLDLSPNENYTVNQLFFKKDNLYVVEVERAKR